MGKQKANIDASKVKTIKSKQAKVSKIDTHKHGEQTTETKPNNGPTQRKVI